jgi:hypothetical protein
MAATKVSGAFIPFAKTIEGCSFAGKYVCDRCLEPCSGVLLKDASDVEKNERQMASLWLCETCIAGGTRKVRSESQKQALIARLAMARAARQVGEHVKTWNQTAEAGATLCHCGQPQA